MRFSKVALISLVVGTAAALIMVLSRAGAEDVRTDGPTAEAVFAGGCFWCVEADFDKIEGVISTESGYTGGSVANPSYRQVVYEDTGHLEAVRVVYNPDIVSYEELVEDFFRTIDPTDPRGQFCDKGQSYRSAVFVATSQERAIVEAEIAEIEESGVLPGPVVTSVRTLGRFWPAEAYHQDYYLKKPTEYKLYRQGCGRDARLRALWD